MISSIALFRVSRSAGWLYRTSPALDLVVKLHMPPRSVTITLYPGYLLVTSLVRCLMFLWSVSMVAPLSSAVWILVSSGSLVLCLRCFPIPLPRESVTTTTAAGIGGDRCQLRWAAHTLSLLDRHCVSCDVLPTRESIKYTTRPVTIRYDMGDNRGGLNYSNLHDAL